jgi:FkbH-like protein
MNSWNEVQEILGKANDGKHSTCIKVVDSLNKVEDTWFTKSSIRFLRNYTLETLEPFLKLAGYRSGIKISVSFSDYDNYLQEVLDVSSLLHTNQPDMIVLSLWLDNMLIAFDKQGRLQTNAVLDHVTFLIDKIKQQISSQIAINTFLQPIHHTGLGQEMRELITINQRLRDFTLEDNRLMLVDFDRLVGEVGLDNTLDLRYWFIYKSPLKTDFLQLWAAQLAQGVASIKGRTKKVLVLDCDNTLWGGILGEDGFNGIKLDAHEYPGNVYHTFQKQILELQRTGVLLALCSKNNESDVMTVLDTHPDCLIHQEHLASWQINWENKVDNLKSLAQRLNIGLDSFVFIDDNPVECEMVRNALPIVDVLQIPSKLYELPKLLQKYRGFNQLVNTSEDSYRTSLYQTERLRKTEADQYQDIDSFLASLQLVAEIGEALPNELDRVTQLTQKTNQFNLTTRRYSQGEIERLYSSKEHLILIMKVADKYGDYGLTGLAILVKNGDECHIDTFLMSCRILGRKLEDVFLKEMIQTATDKWGNLHITAEYVKTQKNHQVVDFFDRRCFTLIKESNEKRSYVFHYQSQLSINLPNYPNYIKIIRR